MLDQLRDGDVVIVWKLDRLSRSLKDLLSIMEKIDAAPGLSRRKLLVLGAGSNATRPVQRGWGAQAA